MTKRMDAKLTDYDFDLEESELKEEVVKFAEKKLHDNGIISIPQRNNFIGQLRKIINSYGQSKNADKYIRLFDELIGKESPIADKIRGDVFVDGLSAELEREKIRLDKMIEPLNYLIKRFKILQSTREIINFFSLVEEQYLLAREIVGLYTLKRDVQLPYNAMIQVTTNLDDMALTLADLEVRPYDSLLPAFQKFLSSFKWYRQNITIFFAKINVKIELPKNE